LSARAFLAAAVLTTAVLVLAGCGPHSTSSAPAAAPPASPSASPSASPATAPAHFPGKNAAEAVFAKCITRSGWGLRDRDKLVKCLGRTPARRQAATTCVTDAIAAMWAKYKIAMVLSHKTQQAAFGYGKLIATYCLLKHQVKG
jgi:hypothetical protein